MASTIAPAPRALDLAAIECVVGVVGDVAVRGVGVANVADGVAADGPVAIAAAVDGAVVSAVDDEAVVAAAAVVDEATVVDEPSGVVDIAAAAAVVFAADAVPLVGEVAAEVLELLGVELKVELPTP